jgi:transcription initiation factor IIF auxiliary subunit
LKDVVWKFYSSIYNNILSKLNDNFLEVTTFPFEIHEVGWGEFEIGIQIHFHNEYQKPIEITHLLKVDCILS